MKQLSLNALETTSGGWCFLGGFGSCKEKDRVRDAEGDEVDAFGLPCTETYYSTRVLWANIGGGWKPNCN